MTESSDPATARKRRKEIMQSLRAAGDTTTAAESGATAGTETTTAIAAAAPQESSSAPPKKRRATTAKKNGESNNNKKTQIRYDPDVPMSKEQLAAWRREARRVRNRESAAASRQRIRDRIHELEDEVGQWKAKYDEAMARLQQVEQMKAQQQQQESANV